MAKISESLIADTSDGGRELQGIATILKVTAGKSIVVYSC